MSQFDRKLRSARIEEEQEERRKIRLMPLILLVLIIAAVVLLILWSRNKEKSYNACDVTHLEELDGGSFVQYAAFDGGYIVYDKDGIRGYSAGGEQLWNAAYNLKNPVIAMCSPYVAVADKGNQQFLIIDNKGTVSRYTVTGKLAGIEVASQGVTAVLITEKDRDYICLYEPGSSAQLVDIMLMTASSGFPVTMALSQDGRKLVTSYLSLSGGTLQSWVTFYNFGEVGQNYVDNMVGSYAFDAIVPEVDFVTNDIVLVGRDDGIVLYRMTETPKVMLTEDYTDEIGSLFFSGEYTGVVLKNRQNGRNRLLMYRNDRAKKILDMQLAFDYTGVYTAGEDIVLYGGQEMTVLRMNGEEKFHTVFTKNVRYIFRVDDRERYLVIGDQEAETIRLKRQ